LPENELPPHWAYATLVQAGPGAGPGAGTGVGGAGVGTGTGLPLHVQMVGSSLAMTSQVIPGCAQSIRHLVSAAAWGTPGCMLWGCAWILEHEGSWPGVGTTGVGAGGGVGTPGVGGGVGEPKQ